MLFFSSSLLAFSPNKMPIYPLSKPKTKARLVVGGSSGGAVGTMTVGVALFGDS